MIVTVMMILLAFSVYTFLLNRYQESGIEAALQVCTTGNVPSESFPKLNDNHLPDKADFDKKYKEFSGRKWSNSKYEFLNVYIGELVKRKKYAEAMEYLIYKYEYERRYLSNYYLNYDVGHLAILLRHNPSPETLERLNRVQKQMLQKKLKFLKKNIHKYAKLLTKEDGSKEFCSQYYLTRIANRGKKQSKSADFKELYLSPLLVNRNLDTCMNLLYALKCVNYGLGHSDTEILKYRFSLYSLGYVLNNIHNYNGLYKQQQLIAAVAQTRFKLKYGRSPKSINELVPEFLSSHELMLFYVPFSHPRRGNPSRLDYLARMKPNSLKELNSFMAPYRRYKRR
jgi:hypothetical protein